MPVGVRQVRYTPRIANDILRRYGAGESISEICADPSMPDRMTLWRWRQERDDFATAFARARQSNAETIEDHMLDIERRVQGGELDPQAANVVLTSQRWRARVLHPERFSERAQHDVRHSGGIGFAITVDLSKRD